MRTFRFAPSPTGKMHLGNARTALLNYYGALQTNGVFFLRIDDTDENRDKDEYEKSIYEDLKWLHIKYDTIIKQSERSPIYEEYFQKLVDMKRVYECFETEDELQEGSIYNRKALYLTEEEKSELRKTRKSYWRFFMKYNQYELKDGIMGRVRTKRSWSDPIIKRPRNDKAFTYNFTSAIDDMLMQVTDIIRGQEHLNNAIIQQEIISCFVNREINFFHLPVIITPEGQKLSKRLGDLSISTLAHEGFHYTSVISICLSLGTNKPPLISNHMHEFKDYFSLKSFSKSSPKFEKKNLQLLNNKILKQLSEDQLKELNFAPDIWYIICNNVSSLNDYFKWYHILNYPHLYKPFEFRQLLKNIYVNNMLKFQLIEDINLRKKFLIHLHESLTGERSGPEIEKVLNYKIQFEDVKNSLL